MTKTEYEAELNELEIPAPDRKSEGGRIPDQAKLGTWTRRHDPVAFIVGFQEWKREREALIERVRRNIDKTARGGQEAQP